MGLYRANVVNSETNIVVSEHNMVKNTNWQEADQLIIYKHRRRVGLRITANNCTS